MLSYVSCFEKSYIFQRWYCGSLTYFIWQILCYCLLYNPPMSWYIEKHLEAWFLICFSLSMWKIIVQYYLRIYDILFFRYESTNKKNPNQNTWEMGLKVLCELHSTKHLALGCFFPMSWWIKKFLSWVNWLLKNILSMV